MFSARSFRQCVAAVVLVAVCGARTPALGGEVHRALHDGKTDEALALLAKDPALIEAQDDSQQTPLHVAAYMGRTEAVKWLLDHKAKVNAIAYNGFTPLHLTGEAGIAKALIKAGADLDQKDSWGNTPIQMAARQQKQAVVDAILASGYKLDLRTAVMLKKRDLVKTMLRDNPALAKAPTKGANLWGSSTPLGLAASQKDRELVELLLDAGANVNERTFMPNAGGDASALTNAVWAGDKEIVALLLKRGARTDVTGGKFYDTILEYARKHSSREIVKLLEEAR